MKSSLTKTLISAGVLAIMIAWYLVYEGSVRPEREEAKQAGNRIVQLDKDEIQEVTIQRAANSTNEDSKLSTAGKQEPLVTKIDLKKSGEEWKLISPVEADADATTVISLVGSLVSAEVERVVETDPKDLERFGLKQPRMTIQVRKDMTTEPVVVLVGNDTPVGNFVYAQIKGDNRILTTSRSLNRSFDKKVSELRNKKFVKWARSEVDEVDVKNPSGSFIVKKEAGDEWTLARKNLPVDSSEWNKTLNAVVDLNAQAFPDETDKSLWKYAMTNPQVKLEIHQRKTNKRATLWLSKKDDKYFAKLGNHPRVYEVSKDAYEKTSRKADDYVSKSMAKFNRFEVQRIKLEHRSSGLVELAQQDSNWVLPADNSKQIDKDKVDKLLTSLQDIEVLRYDQSTTIPAQLRIPELTIRLYEKDGDKGEKESLTLKFAKPTGKDVLSMRASFPLPFFIKTDDFKKISLNTDAFIKKDEPKKEEGQKTNG